jgi:periplasmic protein TonB
MNQSLARSDPREPAPPAPTGSLPEPDVPAPPLGLSSVAQSPEPADSAPAPAVPAVDTGAAPFGSFIGADSARRQGSGVRRLTAVVSIAAHGALLAVGLVTSFWQVDELSAPRVSVTFISLPVAPPPPPPAARKAEARPRPQRPLRQPVVVPTEVKPLQPEAADQDKDKDKDKDPDKDQQAGVAGGTSGGVAGGVVGALSSAPPPRVPELSAHQRQALIRRYLEEILRPRILARFRFPPEAERLGIEGQVLVQASIDGSGRLLGLRPVGSCADDILCEDAARTIREAAPFPPPPAALAEGLKVEVPLTYRLQ